MVLAIPTSRGCCSAKKQIFLQSKNFQYGEKHNRHNQAGSPYKLLLAATLHCTKNGLHGFLRFFEAPPQGLQRGGPKGHTAKVMHMGQNHPFSDTQKKFGGL